VNETKGILGGPQRRPLLNALRNRAVAGAVARGVSEQDARAALAEIESDRPLLDWLANGGLEKIIDLILKLLAVL
jgi:hypothetical protein